MYDANQDLILDHLLRFAQIPLAVLEAKPNQSRPLDGIQQGKRYAERLGLRFFIASNGREYILVTAKQANTSPHRQLPRPTTS